MATSRSTSPCPRAGGLAKQLKVARNTVILAYEHLLEDGYPISRQRSGYFVNPDILDGSVSNDVVLDTTVPANSPDWAQRMKSRPSAQQNIRKPRDWQTYPYLFAYGQLDVAPFPTNNWRECCRDAVSVRAIRDWATDHFDKDDPMLIEQIHTRLLPRRGNWAQPEQILLTVGAQHALYMIVGLLLDSSSTLGLENPGYVDIRNIALLNPSNIKALAVDADGLIIDENINDCDCLFVTRSHQTPTTVTMPIERRYELLKCAAESDIVLIEDDYESEINYATSPASALKSLDQNDRVLYVGSLSKTLAPGLRNGLCGRPGGHHQPAARVTPADVAPPVGE